MSFYQQPIGLHQVNLPDAEGGFELRCVNFTRHDDMQVRSAQGSDNSGLCVSVSVCDSGFRHDCSGISPETDLDAWCGFTGTSIYRCYNLCSLYAVS